MKFQAKWFLLFAVVCLGPVADAGSLPLEKRCDDALTSRFPGWRPATVTAEVAAWAKQNKFDPVQGNGDFDDDGRLDKAVLVQHAGKRKVAVCMGTADGVRLIVIEQPYCSDYLFISKAGSKHYNFDTEKTEVIKHDGISVACFEQAGATYLYEDGVFRLLVDSD